LDIICIAIFIKLLMKDLWNVNEVLLKEEVFVILGDICDYFKGYFAHPTLKPSYLHMRRLAGFLNYLRPITKLFRAASTASVVMDVR
jgi:hypothetical protein